jgi:hypothetical protein
MSQYLATSKVGSQRSVYPVPTYALPKFPYTAGGAAYTRPADWTAIPSLTPGTDKKIYILAAIFNDASNQFALACSGSAGYTVDWGDGLGTVNYATGVQANYNIAWANVSSGTLTTRGYRQALITITPQGAGTLTNLNLQRKNSSNTATGVPANNWLEVAICSAALTTFNIGGTTAYASFLEKINFVETGTITTMASVFADCWSLQSVNAPTNITSTADLSNCFQRCYSLRTAPSFPTITSPTSLASMFDSCWNLQDPGTIAANNTVSAFNMFQNCYNLINGPAFSGVSLTLSDPRSIFSNCYCLRNAPNLTIGTAPAGLNTMFSNCVELRTAPMIRLPSSGATYAATSMFSNCHNLKTIPNYDWSRCSNFTTVFNACASLESIGPIDASNATTLNSMFTGCQSLKNVGTITTTSALTNLGNMFQNCYSLQAGPVITVTSGVTVLISMYASCRSLTYAPDLSCGAVTDMTSMFTSCFSLTTAPNITMTASSSLTQFPTMFNACFSLTTVPNYTTWSLGAGVNATQMFNQCISLQAAPTINQTNKIVNGSGMFTQCSSLREVPAYDLNLCTNVSSIFLSCPTLQQGPGFSNTANITNVNQMFNGCGSLQNIPAYNLTGVSSAANFTSFVTNCANLSRVQASNTRFSLSYANSKLAGAQLDEIYTNLPTITAQTITVTGNWGTATDTPSIATGKGWTVTGT